VKALIAVLTTRAGQTSTYWALSLAWTLSETRRVLLIDCDMEGGTIADLLYLRVDDRGIANCFGEHPASPATLEAQAIAVPGNPDLRIVPGLRSTYGYEIGECLRQLHPAIQGADADVAIVDLGHPLGHPGLRSPRSAGDAISKSFQRIFVVVRDEPALIARTVEVLRAARLTHGELVVCAQRSATYRRALSETLERELPELAVRNGWVWDERRAARMAESGRPMQLARAASELQL
jgi:MinD-like ATPase involved in chromosome partitioning or flagellar assembly